jgi:hypothetical protein
MPATSAAVCIPAKIFLTFSFFIIESFLQLKDLSKFTVLNSVLFTGISNILMGFDV